MNKYKTMIYMVVIALLELSLVLSLTVYQHRANSDFNFFRKTDIESFFKKATKNVGNKENKSDKEIKDISKTEKNSDKDEVGDNNDTDDAKDIEIVEEEIPMGATPLDIISLEDLLEDSLVIGDSRIISMYNRLHCETGVFAFDAALTSKDLEDKQLLCSKSWKDNAYELVGKKHKYKKVYLAVGINDIDKNKISDFYSNIKKYVNYIKRYQNCKIYICSIVYVSGEKSGKNNEKNKKIDKYNKQLKQISIEHGIAYIEMNKMLKTKNNTLKSTYTIDGINLNTEGCSVLGSTIIANE